MMNVLRIRKVGNLFRRGALCGSAIAFLMFVFGFATDKQLVFLIQQFVAGQVQQLSFSVFLFLILAVFIGYLIAASKKHAHLGSMFSLCSVVAIFTWCRASFNFSPSPFLAVLACPALLHILAGHLHRLSLQGKVDAPQKVTDEVANTSTLVAC